jgi:hypothetical protein
MSFELIDSRHCQGDRRSRGWLRSGKGTGQVTQYHIIYKDGSSQYIDDAVTYDLDGSLYIFRDEDGEIVSRILVSEVRSITKLKEPSIGIA